MAIQQRGKSYLVNIPMGKGKKRATATAHTLKEAKALEHQMIADRDRGGLLPTSKTTVSAWLKDWLEKELPARRPRPAQRTLETYRVTVEKHITPNIGDYTLAKLTPLILMGLERTLLETLSPATVCQVHAVLKSALDLAVVGGLLAHNPLASVRPPRRESKPFDALEPFRVRDFLALAQEDAPAYALAYHLAAVTGMRRGEVLGLKWINVNLADGFLEVREQLQRTMENGLVDGAEPKHGSRRRIDLDAGTVDLLIGHRKAQDARGGCLRVFDDGKKGGTLSLPTRFTRRPRRSGSG